MGNRDRSTDPFDALTRRVRAQDQRLGQLEDTVVESLEGLRREQRLAIIGLRNEMGWRLDEDSSTASAQEPKARRGRNNRNGFRTISAIATLLVGLGALFGPALAVLLS